MPVHTNTPTHSDDDARPLFDDREAHRQADLRRAYMNEALPNVPSGIGVGAERHSASL